jgi:hypothetical protein
MPVLGPARFCQWTQVSNLAREGEHAKVLSQFGLSSGGDKLNPWSTRADFPARKSPILLGVWSGREDSNLRSPGPEPTTDVLSCCFVRFVLRVVPPFCMVFASQWTQVGPTLGGTLPSGNDHQLGTTLCFWPRRHTGGFTGLTHGEGNRADSNTQRHRRFYSSLEDTGRGTPPRRPKFPGIGAGPLQELDLGDYLRTQPNTSLHFLRSKPLTAAAGCQLRKVGEGAVGRPQVLNPFEHPRRVAGTSPALTRAA